MSHVDAGLGLRVVQMPDPNMAMGVATRFTLAEPAYARLLFGDWAKALDGLISRGHYGFILDDKSEVRGFAGWALTSRAKAEDWAEGRDPLTNEDCKAGECLIFNVWIAKGSDVHRFMVDAFRAAIAGKETLYFRRTYADGTARTVRLPVTDAVASHMKRLAELPNALNDAPANAV